MKKDINIVYSLSGEGRGHASVALALHEELTKRLLNLNIFFFCGGKAYTFLKKAGMDVFEIPALLYKYNKGAVRPVSTITNNLRLKKKKKEYIQGAVKNRIKAIDPLLIITDFEYFVPRISEELDIPFVNIDHQGIIRHARYPVTFQQFFNWIGSLAAVHMITRPPLFHIITSFFSPPLKNTKNKLLVGPIVRPELFENDEEQMQDFILVYVMDDSFKWVLSSLKNFKDQKFIVTGIDPSSPKPADNIMIKNIDPAEFLKDMRQCKAVIATAGHSLIGEALTLKKPLLVLRQPNQFEQFLNAFYIEKLGYGMACKAKGDITPAITRFLDNLTHFKNKIQKTFMPGNKKACDKIIEILDSLC